MESDRTGIKERSKVEVEIHIVMGSGFGCKGCCKSTEVR